MPIQQIYKQRFARLKNWCRALLSCLLTTVLLGLSYGQLQAASLHLSEQLLNRVKEKYGEDASKRLNNLAKMVDKNKEMAEKDKVEAVNDFFNQVPYYTDIVHWKQKDYWATPIEKLATFGGDCEDYAIAKYFTLRELGVGEKKLRIMYVKALQWNEAHMVLAYYTDPKKPPLVLDNINPKLLPANKRKDLLPVYSFNADGLYIAKAKSSGKRVGGSEKLKLWTSLMKKMDGSDI